MDTYTILYKIKGAPVNDSKKVYIYLLSISVFLFFCISISLSLSMSWGSAMLFKTLLGKREKVLHLLKSNSYEHN